MRKPQDTAKAPMSAARWRLLERACWIAAMVLILPQLAAMAGRQLGAGPDDSWSASRRAAYQRLLRAGGVPSPVGRLRLEKQGIVMPVFSGTGEAALTLGAGHLRDTAALDGNGNIAIAGHRDGFFRSLRNLAVGDRLTLITAKAVRTFRVSGTSVVAPEDVEVLAPTSSPVLTLITCYPFYYVGHAPKRFVVRARLVAGGRRSPADSAQPAELAIAR